MEKINSNKKQKNLINKNKSRKKNIERKEKTINRVDRLFISIISQVVNILNNNDENLYTQIVNQLDELQKKYKGDIEYFEIRKKFYEILSHYSNKNNNLKKPVKLKKIKRSKSNYIRQGARSQGGAGNAEGVLDQDESNNENNEQGQLIPLGFNQQEQMAYRVLIQRLAVMGAHGDFATTTAEQTVRIVFDDRIDENIQEALENLQGTIVRRDTIIELCRLAGLAEGNPVRVEYNPGPLAQFVQWVMEYFKYDRLYVLEAKLTAVYFEFILLLYLHYLVFNLMLAFYSATQNHWFNRD